MLFLLVFLLLLLLYCFDLVFATTLLFFQDILWKEKFVVSHGSIPGFSLKDNNAYEVPQSGIIVTRSFKLELPCEISIYFQQIEEIFWIRVFSLGRSGNFISLLIKRICENSPRFCLVEPSGASMIRDWSIQKHTRTLSKAIVWSVPKKSTSSTFDQRKVWDNPQVKLNSPWAFVGIWLKNCALSHPCGICWRLEKTWIITEEDGNLWSPKWFIDRDYFTVPSWEMKRFSLFFFKYLMRSKEDSWVIPTDEKNYSLTRNT